MFYLFSFILIILFLFLTFSILYQYTIFIFGSFKEKLFQKESLYITKKFAVIVPAHNEGLIIESLCDNLKKIEYNDDNYEIFIVADNCHDNTTEICRRAGFTVLERFNETEKGKGYAIKYALDIIKIDDFDSVLIIDADTHVKPDILNQLSLNLCRGDHAIQCYIEVPNKDESWFTQLLSLARVMNGLMYHYPKSKLGLSSYLMGSGICFSAQLLKQKSWTAFSIAEDWEYYAQILLDGYKVAFSRDAIVYQSESKSLNQATSQRLRWSRGRWVVTKSLGLDLLKVGIKKKNYLVFDSSLPLILPNFSLQFNLTILGLFLSSLFYYFYGLFIYFLFFLSLMILQVIYIFIGMILAGNILKLFFYMSFAPIFLVWKACIDFVSFTGLYKGRKWVRTKRYKSK